MRHLMSPLDFSVEELDKLLDLAQDIEAHPAKYAHALPQAPVLLQKEKVYLIRSARFPAMQTSVL